MKEETRTKVLLALAIIGFLFALAAGLSHRFDWLDAFCRSVSDSCRETDKFTALGVPLWVLGAGFYLLLMLVVLVAKRAIFWMAGCGFGVEAGLVWIMYSMKLVCVFCLANAIVVVLLLLACFEIRRFWQNLAVSAVAMLFTLLCVTHASEPLASPAMPENPGLAAKVGQQVITLEEVEMPLSMRTYELEMQIYRLKKDRLDQLIAENVLQKEAERQGVPLQQFVNDTVLGKTGEVSAEEVERYYQENPAVRANWRGSPEELEKRVKSAIQQRKSFQLVMDYARKLYDKEPVVVYLKEPQLPQVQVNIADDASSGPADAPVTIIEFSDYLCPACRKTHETMRILKEQYKGQVRWVFKDFPLRMHKWAAKAAEATRCAAEQGKYHEYQDVLFASSKELTPEQLTEHAKEVGLAGEQFSQCLESGRNQSAVDRDVQEGHRVGVNSTPTMVVNGKVVTGGASLDFFKKLIEEEIEKAKGKQK